MFRVVRLAARAHRATDGRLAVVVTGYAARAEVERESRRLRQLKEACLARVTLIEVALERGSLAQARAFLRSLKVTLPTAMGMNPHPDGPQRKEIE